MAIGAALPESYILPALSGAGEQNSSVCIESVYSTLASPQLRDQSLLHKGLDRDAVDARFTIQQTVASQIFLWHPWYLCA